MGDMQGIEQRISREMLRRAGPSESVDDLAIFESVIAASPSRRWGFSMFAALRFVAASVVVALFGGFLLAGVLNAPEGGGVSPGAAVTSSPTPTVYRFIDPPGDAADGSPDILGVTTTVSADALLLEVAFAEEWDPTESRLIVWLYPDLEMPSDYSPIRPAWEYAPSSMPSSSPEPDQPPHYCNPYFVDFVEVDVTERPDLADLFGTGATMATAPEALLAAWPDDPLPYEVDGTHLRLTLPLTALGYPDTLGLHLMDPDDEGVEPNEQFPDAVDVCVLVPLGER